MTNYAHTLSARYVATQTGASFIRTHANEVAMLPRRRSAHRSAQNMAVRLAIMLAQAVVVGAVVTVVLLVWEAVR